MERDDLTVEVRDKNLIRQGNIPMKELKFQFSNPHNNVGTWKAEVPAESELASALRVPGSGVIVYNKSEVIFSGPTIKPQFLATKDDPAGTITFEGVSDDIHLADMLAWPDPANTIDLQATQKNTHSGFAETIIHAFVNLNIGPGALVARRTPHLIMGTDGARGASTQKSSRFEVLGEVIGGVAKVADLGFRIIQRGNNLVFETYAIRDRTDEIRLDVRNNTLSAQKLTVAAPEITHAVVIGKGTGETARSLNLYTTTDSLAAEADWGRRIERVVSSTSTDVAAELQQAGLEQLVEKGYTSVSVQVAPLENNGMNFPEDWGLGDRVAVVVDEQEYISVVTKFELRADETGFFLGAGLGDPAEFDPTVALRKRVAQTGNRISALERNG